MLGAVETWGCGFALRSELRDIQRRQSSSEKESTVDKPKMVKTQPREKNVVAMPIPLLLCPQVRLCLLINKERDLLLPFRQLEFPIF